MRRSALVTGASRGIGRGIARALAEKGWPVCVNYLEHRDAAESLAEELRKDSSTILSWASLTSF